MWQWIEPWSVVSSTGTPRRSASRNERNSAESSNQVAVTARSAWESRATSNRIAFSARPCVSWSMKLKTSAVTPFCDRYPGTRRTSASPSDAVASFSYRTGTESPTSSLSCSPSSSASWALRLSSSLSPHQSGCRSLISTGNRPLKMELRENGVAVGRMLK